MRPSKIIPDQHIQPEEILTWTIVDGRCDSALQRQAAALADSGDPQQARLAQRLLLFGWKRSNEMKTLYLFSPVQNVPDLIRFHIKTQKPVYRQGTKLSVWVNREQWELYHGEG